MPLTPGVPVQFTVPKNAVNARINNFSRYFVGIFFGDPLPGGSSATALAPGFHYIAEPGEKPTLEIVGNYTQDPALRTNLQNDFTGNIYLVPISVDANLGLTGGQSSNFATVTSYLAGEDVPASSSSSRIVDSSSQERVIALRDAVPTLNDRQHVLGATGSDIALRTDGVGSLPTTAAGSQGLNVYCYYCYFGLYIPSAGSRVGADCTLFADVTNAGVIILSFAMHHINAEAYQSTALGSEGLFNDTFFPAVPNVHFFSLTGQTVTDVRWRLHVNGVTTAGEPAHWDIGVATDLTNFRNPGTYGAFTPNTGTIF